MLPYLTKSVAKIPLSFKTTIIFVKKLSKIHFGKSFSWSLSNPLPPSGDRCVQTLADECHIKAFAIYITKVVTERAGSTAFFRFTLPTFFRFSPSTSEVRYATAVFRPFTFRFTALSVAA